jgi:pimeloyl-ACP methyl ester carboxylesterase
MTAALPRSAQALQSSYILFFQLPWLPERVLPRVLHCALVRSGLPAAATERYLHRLCEPGALTAALNWYRALPWSLSTPTGQISVPTTYVWGRSDPALGRTAAELTRQHVPDRYRFEELDAGHWLPETRPAEVAALIVQAAARPTAPVEGAAALRDRDHQQLLAAEGKAWFAAPTRRRRRRRDPPPR